MGLFYFLLKGMRRDLMFIVLGIIAYLFVGFVIGSAMCVHAGDNPRDRDSVGAILFIGVIWPAIIIFISLRVLVTLATTSVEVLVEWLADNKQEQEESDGEL